MRLLNVNSRMLEEFPGSVVPKYAILSHTWGKDEVTLQDLLSPDVESKAGYKKIKYSCLQAIKDGLAYVWVDTCSIDKSSSAELSEAINSMFAWYRNAAVCYAYLEDVRASSVDEDLPNAKWFTRGWTLQELLAPNQVVFYGKDWTSLGHKDAESERITDFTSKLALITEIDEMVLWKPAYMRVKSVAARMSWASKRTTTRVEDLAYCMLGIFGVNMPLLYGEGDRAFIRLQEEIIKISDDHSIFAWDHDFGENVTVSCLANSPSWFRRGAYVVPFGRKQLQSTSYAITNQGLQIQLPLVTVEGSEVIYGLINCHWENTLSGCIGIPLRGSIESQFFERSSRLPPKTIFLKNLPSVRKRTIFLSIRPPVELPFAAEITLQVYDRAVKDHGFSDLEITNNPMASYHWHHDYENFRLRWLSRSQNTQIETLGLVWTHEIKEEAGFVVVIQGRIDNRGNDGLGTYQALKIGILFRGSNLETWFEDCIKKFPQDSDTSRAITEPVLAAKCTIKTSGSTLDVSAILEQKDIFGNEAYTLTIDAQEQ